MDTYRGAATAARTDDRAAGTPRRIPDTATPSGRGARDQRGLLRPPVATPPSPPARDSRYPECTDTVLDLASRNCRLSAGQAAVNPLQNRKTPQLLACNTPASALRRSGMGEAGLRVSRSMDRNQRPSISSDHRSRASPSSALAAIACGFADGFRSDFWAAARCGLPCPQLSRNNALTSWLPVPSAGPVHNQEEPGR